MAETLLRAKMGQNWTWRICQETSMASRKSQGLRFTKIQI